METNTSPYPLQLSGELSPRLSRGIVLVKWWLLAIPHYLVIAVFVGGAWAGAGIDRLYGGGGLVGLLVLFAGVMLLFTSRYPKPLYDFVLGMKPLGLPRRCLRRADDRHPSAVPARDGRKRTTY
jgi:hypothetical protein